MDRLEKPDGGAESWGPSAPTMGTPKTLADQAVRRLRDAIIGGELQPDEKLLPDVLKDRYGIGLSPIREALSRLASAGLVHAEGQRGFSVASVSEAELLDVADLRCRFSVMALERSIVRGREAWETEVVGTYYQLNKLAERMRERAAEYPDEWEARNRAFHTALEGACGSPWLRYFCEILYDQSERYRHRFVLYPEIKPRIYDEHRQIMEAALARDAATACRILAEHVWHGVEEVRLLMRGAAGARPAPLIVRLDRETPTDAAALRRGGSRAKLRGVKLQRPNDA